MIDNDGELRRAAWLTRAEAARYARVSLRTIDRAIHSGQLRAVHAGAHDELEPYGTYVAVTDEHLVIVAVSPAFAELLGYPPGELVGMSGVDVSAGDVDARLQRFRRTLKAAGSERHLTLLRARDGREIPYRSTTHTLATANGPLYVSTGEPVRQGRRRTLTKPKWLDAWLRGAGPFLVLLAALMLLAYVCRGCGTAHALLRHFGLAHDVHRHALVAPRRHER